MSRLRSGGDRTPATSLPAVLRDRREGVEPALLWALGVGLVLLSVFYLWNVLTIPEPPRVLQVSVNAYPLLVAGFMIAAALLSLGVLGRESIRWRKAGDVPESMTGENQVSSWRDVAIGGLGLIALVLLMPALGYVVCAAAFIVGVASYFAPRKIVRNILAGVILALLTYILFDYLGVRLPEGFFPLPIRDLLPY